MTDKEILGTVYRWINQSFQRDETPEFSQRRMRDCKDFIEQEWQKQDEKNSPPPKWVHEDWQHSYPPVDPCTSDVKEIERHRGLEMGEDGTVERLK